MLREVRRLTEEEAVLRWAELYVAGKHAGYATPDPSLYLGRDLVWVEVEIPHALYDADWNTRGAELSPAQVERATRYAIQSGRLPPGMAGYRGNRLRGKVYVTDGNHRAYAAYLRRDPVARFFMPANEWERFLRAVNRPELG
jgi:hypothetical protein